MSFFHKNKRLLAYSSIFSIIFSIANYLGYLSEQFGSIKYMPQNIWILPILFIFSFIAFTTLTFLIGKCSQRKKIKSSKLLDKIQIKHPILFGQIILYALWIPSFLALYPGLFIYDAYSQYYMCKSHTVTQHHPIIHTYLVGLTVRGGELLFHSINKGVLVYSIFQMILLGLIFSYSISFFIKSGHKKTWLFSLIWFGLFSPIIIHVFAVTKDSIFSALCVAFITNTIYFLKNEEEFISKKKNLIIWSILLFLCCIFRNNALYAIIVFGIVLFFFVNIKTKKAIGICFICVAAVLILYNGPFTKLVTISGINNKEYLSVPSQQMVRTYINENNNMTQEQNAIIHELFDDLAIEYYNPQIADMTKWHFQTEIFKNNYKKYLQFYINLGMEYPTDYFDSFIVNTYGFWYPFSTYTLNLDGEKGYGVIDSQPPAVQHSLFPQLLNYYKLYENSNLVQHNKLTMWFFECGTYFWFILYCFFQGLYRNQKELWLPLIYILILWCTYLLGPVVLIRYSLYLFMLVPTMIMTLFNTQGIEDITSA